MKKQIVLGTVAAVVASAAMAFAQPGAGPGGYCWEDGKGQGSRGMRYDASQETTVTGTIQAVEELGPGRRMGPGLGLRVETGSGTVLAHLGPKGYFDGKNISFAAGETVELTGVKAMRRGQEAFIVSVVKRGSETLELRSENGSPVWAGWRRNAVQQ